MQSNFITCGNRNSNLNLSSNYNQVSSTSHSSYHRQTNYFLTIVRNIDSDIKKSLKKVVKNEANKQNQIL